ncbi:hypothetical protein AJ79_08075 [Helicocarpus griseus UAMH5409]|uniref:Uncharacterized protein n=1 Tax=Helicocarpus griseus UAMH5409 TaxID=1447875 RepID=A0A2B7WWF5_9EURO|nr:hypothetical protein AJ79_08075 [Helicocarpus griseus UAMH5409]
METNSAEPAAPIKPPLSVRWVMGLFLTWVALAIVGALVFPFGYLGFASYGGPSNLYLGLFITGLTSLCLAMMVKIAFWIVVCVRSRQKKRYSHRVRLAATRENAISNTQTHPSPPTQGLHSTETMEPTSGHHARQNVPAPAYTVRPPTSTTAERAGHSIARSHTTSMPLTSSAPTEPPEYTLTPISASSPNLPPMQKGSG